jgi:phage protein D
MAGSLPGTDVARAPRPEVLADGAALVGVLEAEVISNNYYAADRFQVRMALDASPATAAFWASAGEVMLEIRMALAGLPVSLIQGGVDRVRLDPVRRLVTLEGRDLTLRLIEARTQESFVNRTASEVAEILATRHGLSTQVTRTTTKIGRYYQDEHDRITLGQFSRAMTEWDLLTWLARQEGFDVFVRGTTLTFQPAEDAARIFPLAVQDTTALQVERALTLARDIEVTVKSWNSRQQSAFTKKARASGQRQGNTDAVQRHVLVRPNLTEDEALKLAQATLAELTRHRMVLSATMPGELSLAPRDTVLLRGTGSVFDQSYVVEDIARRISVQHGFIQHIRARSDAVPAQATVPGVTYQ